MTSIRRSAQISNVLSSGSIVAGFVLSLAAGLMGCGSGDLGPAPVEATPIDNNNPPPPNQPTPGMAMIRVIHASPDAPSVDVYAEGVDQPLLTGVRYGDATAYLELEPGAYNIELRGSPSTAADPIAYATGPIELAKDSAVSAVAAGLFGSTKDGDKFRVLPLAEQFAPAGSGNAIVRVVHAASDAPSVGIDLGNDDPSAPEMTGVDRFEDTGVTGMPLTAGRAHPIGIVVNGATVTSFTTPELPEGAELFVIATGLLGKLARETDGFSLLAVAPTGAVGFVRQDPLVYALHAGPDAPPVDLFVGDAEIVDNIAFGQLVGPIQVSPGDYTIDIFGHGQGSARPDGAPAVSATSGSLAAGERYLSIATGFLGAGKGAPFRLVSVAEGFELGDLTSARLRAVHGSPDAPAVDLGVLNAEHVVNPVLIGDLQFSEAADAAGLSTSPGTLPLGVTPAGANAQVVASFHVPVTAGARAFGIAAGALDPSKGESFRLLAVDTAATPWTVATVHPQP